MISLFRKLNITDLKFSETEFKSIIKNSGNNQIATIDLD